RTPVDQEIRGMIRLGRDVEAASSSPSYAASRCRNLRQCLPVNVGIHLGPLEQVFPVVVGLAMVVGVVREPEIIFGLKPCMPYGSRGRQGRAAGRIAGRNYNDGPVQAHFD